jgi:RNA polymerase sigma-70 factor (ECF subfamily)
MSVTDDRLVQDALAGRQEAFEGLAQRHARSVFRLIDRLVQDSGVTEELAQETFLKAFRRLDTFDPQRGFSAWLLRIAHNTAVDALRRRGPRMQSLDTAAQFDRDAHVPVSTAPGPDRQTEQRLLMRDVAAALAGLRPEHRLALGLRFQEGRSYAEIAFVMGVAEGTARSYVHRARRKLADDMRTAGWADATDRRHARITE